jgi:FkbM family methyltransferase
MQIATLEQFLALRFRGMGRIRKFLRGPNPFTLVRRRTADGISFALDPESYLEWFIFKNGYYEREVLDAALRYLPEHGVFWDVGANIGLHALTIKRLRPDVSVYAFEPVPFTAARFLLNQSLARAEVELFPIALSDSQGYAKISMKFGGNSGLSSLNPWPNVSYDGVANCRTERADFLIESDVAPSPSVIKIDVEGVELKVIAGLGRHLFSTDLKAVIFESDGQLYDEISALLAKGGLRCSPIPPTNPQETSKTLNFIAHREADALAAGE